MHHWTLVDHLHINGDSIHARRVWLILHFVSIPGITSVWSWIRDESDEVYPAQWVSDIDDSVHSVDHDEITLTVYQIRPRSHETVVSRTIFCSRQNLLKLRQFCLEQFFCCLETVSWPRGHAGSTHRVTTSLYFCSLETVWWPRGHAGSTHRVTTSLFLVPTNFSFGKNSE